MKKLTMTGALLCLIWLAGSLWYWLQQPNNFLYTLETNGQWSFAEPATYRSKGYELKIDSACAEKVYSTLNFPNLTTPDFRRFSKNRSKDIEFHPGEISTPSRFKWKSDHYITYDDPGLTSGILYSFRNKCLYDQECSYRSSADYLFVKIGVKYFLNSAQQEQLDGCVQKKAMFYRVAKTYNFGRSDRHHRNGILQWLSDWLTAIGLSSSKSLRTASKNG